MQKDNKLIGRWSDTLANLPESIDETKGQYLEFIFQNICSDPYLKQYIRNNHPDRKIKCDIITVSIYKGEVINTSRKNGIIISTGDINKIELGCRAWKNPTGADTFYERHWENPEWA